MAGALRYVVVLHFTWLVNSAAHFFGDHPYGTRDYVWGRFVGVLGGVFAVCLRCFSLYPIYPLPATPRVRTRTHTPRPSDNASWPAENPFVSVAAIGEGWHNWHHKVRPVHTHT